MNTLGKESTLENCIFKLNIAYDKEQLTKESKLYEYKPINTETLSNLYSVSEEEDRNDKDDLSFLNNDKVWWKEQESWNTTYKLKDNNSHRPESKRLRDLFKNIVGTDNVKPSFFTQTIGTHVPTHIDVGTLCAINFIISGGETPVEFEGLGKEFYTVALLNVSENHSVPIQTGEDRLLFKLRFTHNTFQEVKDAIVKYQTTMTLR